MKMKRSFKFIYSFFILTAAVGMVLTSCNKEDSSSGTPSINYVRVTDPAKSDSLLAGAYLGNTIAIIGSDLNSVREIWFNDQKAYLNPVLITNTAIMVAVPDSIPKVVTDQMKLVYGSHDTLIYPFRALVPAPTVSSMKCEYVSDGNIATINGDYFIDDTNIPLKVIFPGNLPGEIVNFSKTSIQVKVPTGSSAGPLTVRSLYGSTISKFYFRDNRNIFLNFDNLTAACGWRSGVLGSSDPDPVSGNYVRFSGAMAASPGWNEDAFSFDFWPIANGRPQAPIYSGDLTKAAIKFECNVYSDWSSGAMQMIFTPYDITGTNSYIADGSVPRGLWMPWQTTGTFKTDGWVTITIPLSEFAYTPDGQSSKSKLTADMLYGCTFFIWNGGVTGTACNPGVCIDNIRVVPVN